MMFRLMAVVVVQMSVHLSVVMSPACMDQVSYVSFTGRGCGAKAHGLAQLGHLVGAALVVVDEAPAVDALEVVDVTERGSRVPSPHC